ncbi:MAG: anthranilate phosphoribosyltransferase [Bacteroidales bacterium]|nr:anthranilate phosphoribosyltransferase [Bacteroidales bacterium]
MKNILQRLVNHEELTSETAALAMLKMTSGQCSDAQMASFLTVYQMRGVSVDEFIGFRDALLTTRVPIDLSEYNPIDIVGTGGDGKNTFNISTCACFVVAGAGYKVCKHGNYGATSISGASNVIEQHGVKFTADEDRIKRSIEECNIAYLHAQLFNPAMKHVGPVRKALQLRTIFNLLGPVVNPCLPKRQLLGVADLRQMRLYVNVFQKLGMDFAVVNSIDGYDEISLTGKFVVETNRYQMVRTPGDLGLPEVRPTELFGGNTPQEAARIFDSILDGTATKAQTDVVVANAAFAIQVIEPERQIEECLAIARESIESGRALATLKRFISLNQ